MSNIMDMKDLRNHVHRDGFDKSFRNCFTAKVGEILPVMCEEVLPGDSWKINLREFMRTAPVQTASFGRVRQYYDFYFVPYHLLWDKFPAYIVQTKNAYHAKSLTAAVDDFTGHPYVRLGALLAMLTKMQDNNDDCYSDNGNKAYYNNSKLLSYLGYPTYLPTGTENPQNMALNPFPLLAYQKIYQDYFRFAQWEDAAPWTYNLDYILQQSQLDILPSQNVTDFLANPNFMTLRCCNFDKDYFNGLLPSPQYGDTTMLTAVGQQQIQNLGTLQFTAPSLGTTSSNNINLVLDPGDSYTVRYNTLDMTQPLVAQLSNAKLSPAITLQAQQLSVLMLRQAEAMQKWKEITMSGSPDYREQLSKHWNVDIDASRSQLCQYLGGISSDVDISEVLNTNLDTENAKADIAGKGISAAKGYIDFQSKEYGLILAVYHAKPIIEWSQSSVFPKLLTKTTAADYAIPEFDNIGMQAVLRCEFMYNAAANFFEPVGYAPRYVDYKTNYDRINGEFQKSLAPWVIPHSLDGYNDGSPITYKAFKVAYNVLDNMFGVNADDDTNTDQFYCTAYFDAKVVRNLSRYGLPY